MFEKVSVGEVLGAVDAHEFDGLDDTFGGEKIDAVVAYERLIRHVQAKQLEMVGRLCQSPDFARHPETLVGELALARGVSPGAARSQIVVADTLTYMPSVAGGLADGSISEPTARAISREVTNLGPDETLLVDGVLEAHLAGLTPRRAAELTRHHVVAVDSEAAIARAESNRNDAYLSLFTEPDGVAVLQARGPAEAMVAAHAVLTRWAEGVKAAGDCRTRGQIAVQTLVERVTGLTHADEIDVEIQLVMDAPTLLGEAATPVHLEGYGPISPDVADDLIDAARSTAVRRLLVDPIDGTLVVREPRRRHFDARTSGHVRRRDRRCRQPGCDHRVRHLDHLRDWARGGPSVLENAQGLCPDSHGFKHQPGFSVRTKGRSIEWCTPSGHRYVSHPEPLLPTHAPTARRRR